MISLSKILQHYKESEETFVRNVFHFFKEVELYEYPKEIGFCDPNEQRILDELQTHFNVHLTSNGGYDNAERKVMQLNPESYSYTPEVTIYELAYNLKFHKLEHKHIMGTLYNMGINERLIGDLIVSSEGRVQIIISKSLEQNLPLLQNRYGNIPVKYELIDEVSIVSKKPQNAIRSSKTKRLDSICKAITHKSRSLMAKEIKKGNVYLNHSQTKSPIVQVEIGDIVSIRGYGRAEITDIIPVNGKYNVKYTTTNPK